MARKRKVVFVEVSSCDCSDGEDVEELSLPDNSSDGEDNDDSNFVDLCDSDVSFCILFCYLKWNMCYFYIYQFVCYFFLF